MLARISRLPVLRRWPARPDGPLEQVHRRRAGARVWLRHRLSVRRTAVCAVPAIGAPRRSRSADQPAAVADSSVIGAVACAAVCAGLAGGERSGCAQAACAAGPVRLWHLPGLRRPALHAGAPGAGLRPGPIRRARLCLPFAPARRCAVDAARLPDAACRPGGAGVSLRTGPCGVLHAGVCAAPLRCGTEVRTAARSSGHAVPRMALLHHRAQGHEQGGADPVLCCARERSLRARRIPGFPSAAQVLHERRRTRGRGLAPSRIVGQIVPGTPLRSGRYRMAVGGAPGQTVAPLQGRRHGAGRR